MSISLKKATAAFKNYVLTLDLLDGDTLDILVDYFNRAVTENIGTGKSDYEITRCDTIVKSMSYLIKNNCLNKIPVNINEFPELLSILPLQLKYNSAKKRILTIEDKFIYCWGEPPLNPKYIDFMSGSQLVECYDKFQGRVSLNDIGRITVTDRWNKKSTETKVRMLQLCGYIVKACQSAGAGAGAGASAEPNYLVFGYKTVRSNMKSIYNSEYCYNIGALNKAHSFDDDERQNYGAGISIWTIPRAIKYALDSNMELNNVKILKMSAYLSDIVLVNGNHKIRASEAFALDDITNSISMEDLAITKTLHDYP